MLADWQASNPTVQNTAGRVAAASLAFSAREQAPPPSSAMRPSPPAIHARHSSNTGASEDEHSAPSPGTRNLVSTKVSTATYNSDSFPSMVFSYSDLLPYLSPRVTGSTNVHF